MTALEQFTQAILAGDTYFVRPGRGSRRVRLAVKHYNAGTGYRWRLRAAAATLAGSLLVAGGIGYATDSWMVFVALSAMSLASVCTSWAVSGDNLEYLLSTNDDIVRFTESRIRAVDSLLGLMAEEARYGSETALLVVANRDKIRLAAARNRATYLLGDHGTNLAAEEAYTAQRLLLERSLAKAKTENAEAVAIESAHALEVAAIEAEHRAALGEMTRARLADEVRELAALVEP